MNVPSNETRIERLLKSVAELRQRAQRCDPDFRAQFQALADEMQQCVNEIKGGSDAMSASPVPATDGDSAAKARHQRRGRLLLVEDEALLRSLLAEFLEEEGFDVVQAPGCSTALICFDRHPEIDCVLSDVRMPDGNGFDLVQNVLSRRPETKAALISGFSDQLPEALAKRGVQLFRKPVPLADLAMHMRDLCGHAP